VANPFVLRKEKEVKERGYRGEDRRKRKHGCEQVRAISRRQEGMLAEREGIG